MSSRLLQVLEKKSVTDRMQTIHSCFFFNGTSMRVCFFIEYRRRKIQPLGVKKRQDIHGLFMPSENAIYLSYFIHPKI